MGGMLVTLSSLWAVRTLTALAQIAAFACSSIWAWIGVRKLRTNQLSG